MQIKKTKRYVFNLIEFGEGRLVMNIDVLFLGRLFPREKEKEIKNKMKTGLQDAANVLQWNIIDGFEENDIGRMKIINYLPIDAYPKGYEDKFIEGFTFSHTDKYDAEDINVHCCNIFGIKRFVNVLYFKRHIRRWAKQKSDKKKVLFSYTANSMFLTLAKLAKKINPDITIACLIADIPEYSTTTPPKGAKKLYHDFEVKKCAKLYSVVDKYILLTKQMAERLGLTAPFTVMEGIANTQMPSANEELAEKYKNEKYVLYSGLLNVKFGIATLLEAFGKITDTDVKLILCGSGDGEELVYKKLKTDDRIVHLGRIDRKSVLALQKNATILVNPRQNNEDFTKYSFPSKNMEYLSSGVPVIAYKLDGIPDEYDDYILYPEDNSAEELYKKIKSVLKMTEEERQNIGEKARCFVFENKNKNKQTQRIFEFIEK